jgi:hypothetical protein
VNVLGAWSREFMQSLLSHGSQKLMLSFFSTWLILIDKELWITTSPTLTLHKIHKKTNKGKPAKAKVMVYL